MDDSFHRASLGAALSASIQLSAFPHPGLDVYDYEGKKVIYFLLKRNAVSFIPAGWMIFVCTSECLSVCVCVCSFANVRWDRRVVVFISAHGT